MLKKDVSTTLISTLALFHPLGLMSDQLWSQMAGLQQPPSMGLPGSLPPVLYGPRCAAAFVQPMCAGSWHHAGKSAEC